MPTGTSPKQPQPEHRRDWYPYYAGYTSDFVAGVLSEHLTDGRVLDPWNGSGTTTAVCAERNQEAVGIDLNPALTIIARARLTPSSVSESLHPLGMKIVELATGFNAPVADDDLLCTWMRKPSVAHVRALQRAIDDALCPPSVSLGDRSVDILPVLACFYYTALFAAVRQLLRRFRATNPTWIRSPASFRHRAQPSGETIAEVFVVNVEKLSKRLTVPLRRQDTPAVTVLTGTANSIELGDNYFAGCVTSPPYATRIDYVKGVLPELAVLGLPSDDIDRLRRLMTGGPVVRGRGSQKARLRSPYGESVLRQIKRHPSKGSRSYYYPWMSKYLGGLEEGLLEVARVVEPDGAICVVAQGSHYKEIEVDLQRVILETLQAADRQLVYRQDFDVKHHMARINPRARKYVQNPRGYESLLIFR